MKKKLYLLVSFLFMGMFVIPMHIEAKKIKYGTTVLYNGKAKDNQPLGVGELSTLQGKTVLDLLKGTFTQEGTVDDAELTFASGWKFTGQLSYEVQPDGSSVTYVLKSGDLRMVSMTAELAVEEKTVQVVPETPLRLTRLPKADGCGLTTDGTYFNIAPSLVTEENTSPLTQRDLGTLAKARAFGGIQQLGNTPAERQAIAQTFAQKGYSGIVEPWGVGLFADRIELADGSLMECKDENGKTFWTITSPNGDYFKYQHEATVAAAVTFAKTLADGSKLQCKELGKWTLDKADKSKLEGKAHVKMGTIEMQPGGIFSGISVNTLYDTYKSLTTAEVKPYDAILTRADGTTTKYTNGYSADDYAARNRLREQLLDQDSLIALEPIDVVGRWYLEDPNQDPHSSSYYVLSFTEDGKVFFTFYADYYGPWEKGNSTPFYQKGTIIRRGIYELQGSDIVFKWYKRNDDDMELKDFSATPLQPMSSNQRKLSQQDENMANMVRQALKSGNLLSVSNIQLVFKSSSCGSLSFSRSDGRKAIQKADANMQFDTNGCLTSFKHYYNDGVMTFTGNDNYVIEYSNGDRYQGTALVSTLRTTSSEELSKRILNVPSLSDMDILYWTGTLTLANGKTIKYTKMMTERQQQGLQNNLEAAVNDLNAMAQAELSTMRENAARAKQTLLSEGYPARYVNALFDRYTVMIGTPKELIDRALELKCHITRHPVVLTDTHTDDKTYGILIVNPNTGQEMFEGYIRFYWLTDRVNYVGLDVR